MIETVSKESVSRDLYEKYNEYQAGGVREYWIIDPLRNQADFYALGDNRRYKRIETKEGIFHSTILPDFTLNPSLLWDENFLQDDERILALVDAMLKKDT